MNLNTVMQGDCLELMKTLPNNSKASSRPGDIVLDCFCGSGNTLLAAKQHGRHFIGMDIDPHWVDVAKGNLGHVQSFVSIADRQQWLTSMTSKPVNKDSSNRRQLDIWDALNAS